MLIVSFGRWRCRPHVSVFTRNPFYKHSLVLASHGSRFGALRGLNCTFSLFWSICLKIQAVWGRRPWNVEAIFWCFTDQSISQKLSMLVRIVFLFLFFVFLVDKTILLLRLNNKVIPFCDIVSCSSNWSAVINVLTAQTWVYTFEDFDSNCCVAVDISSIITVYNGNTLYT